MTPWTVARQVSLTVEFSQQEYWSGLPFPSQGHLPDPGIEPVSYWQAESLSLTHQGSPLIDIDIYIHTHMDIVTDIHICTGTDTVIGIHIVRHTDIVTHTDTGAVTDTTDADSDSGTDTDTRDADSGTGTVIETTDTDSGTGVDTADADSGTGTDTDATLICT